MNEKGADAPPERKGGKDVPAPKVTWVPPQGLLALSVKNLLLRIVTLGVYHFWARTEVRRRLWGALRIDGEPLVYMGRAVELLRAYLVVGVPLLVLMALYFGAAFHLTGVWPEDLAAAVHHALRLSPPLAVAAFLLLGPARHLVLRYRLRRTRWRGMRGGMGGGAASYGWQHAWTIAPVIITLGLAWPWRRARLRNRLFSDMRFGGGRFVTALDWRRLMPSFLPLWGSVVATILLATRLSPPPAEGRVGAYLLWLGEQFTVRPVMASLLILLAGATIVASLFYHAREMNEIAGATRFEGVRFSMDMTVASLIALLLRNGLLMTLSLGVLKPLAEANVIEHIVHHLKADGRLDLARLATLPEEEAGIGEGLADFLGLEEI